MGLGGQEINRQSQSTKGTQVSVALETCRAGTTQNRNGIQYLAFKIASLKTVFICESNSLLKERKGPLLPMNQFWSEDTVGIIKL